MLLQRSSAHKCASLGGSGGEFLQSEGGGDRGPEDDVVQVEDYSKEVPPDDNGHRRRAADHDLTQIVGADDGTLHHLAHGRLDRAELRRQVLCDGGVVDVHVDIAVVFAIWTALMPVQTGACFALPERKSEPLLHVGDPCEVSLLIGAGAQVLPVALAQ